MSVENPASDNDCDAVSVHLDSKSLDNSFYSSILWLRCMEFSVYSCSSVLQSKNFLSPNMASPIVLELSHMKGAKASAGVDLQFM